MAGKKLLLNEKQIIRAAMKVAGKMQKTVSEEVGISANALKNQLIRADSTMTLTSVYALLNAMGFELVVRDKSGKFGGVEYIVGENREPIAAERYVSAEETAQLDRLREENAAAMLESMKKQ